MFCVHFIKIFHQTKDMFFISNNYYTKLNNPRRPILQPWTIEDRSQVSQNLECFSTRIEAVWCWDLFCVLFALLSAAPSTETVLNKYLLREWKSKGECPAMKTLSWTLELKWLIELTNWSMSRQFHKRWGSLNFK